MSVKVTLSLPQGAAKRLAELLSSDTPEGKKARADLGIEEVTVRPYPIDREECVRLCEALAAFWGDGVCDAPIHPGAYLTEEDIPIRDLVRAAVGWRKP